ncbi:hypothetical protein H4R24_003560 [Coemansia sp. RSA 988]|nr:hypothetical protein H4R24_003560 [Coemansia sp. RSA 988]
MPVTASPSSTSTSTITSSRNPQAKSSASDNEDEQPLLMARRVHQSKQQQQHMLPTPPRRGLWTLYKNITPRHRILLGMSFMGFSMLGLWVSDKLEQRYPASADSRVTHVSHDDAALTESSSRRSGGQ